MGDVITPLDYKRVELALGKNGARLWAQKHGIQIMEGAASGIAPKSPAGVETAATSPTGGLGGGIKVGDDDNEGEDALPVGGLNYADAQREYDLANENVRNQIQSHIDVLETARSKLRDRRVGPSASEKWLAIAAALGQPTRTGSFGESLGNLAQAIGAQKSARREAEEKRDLMLEKYGLDVGTERLRLLQAGAAQAGQTLRAASTAAAKAQAAKEPKYDYSEGEYSLRPGTGDMPPMNGRGQFVVSTRKQALNVPRGKEFVMENDPSGKVYYGQ